MDPINNPHDKFVRETLSKKEVDREFLAEYLPADVLEVIDLNTIQIAKDTFIEKDLHEYYSDLLYHVRFNDEKGYIFLLFEHKSHEDKLVAIQLLGYTLNIWNLHLKQTRQKRLPIVIPLVLYHGRKEWSSGVHLLDLISGPKEKLIKYIPDFEFILYDLTRYSDHEIRGNVVVSAFLLLLKYIMNPKLVEKLPGIVSLLMELEKQETGLKSLETFLTYLFNATDDISAEQFVNILEKSFSDTKGGEIMTLAEQFFEKGKLEGIIQGKMEGILEGKQEGIREGERKGLLDTIALSISLKFGKADPGDMATIRKIENIERLREVFKKIQLTDNEEDFKEYLTGLEL